MKEKIYFIIKRVISSALIIYTLDLFLIKADFFIPINEYSVLFVSLFGIPSLLFITILHFL